MKEVLYAAEKTFLERYLKEKARASLDDFKAASDLWGKPVPDPGTDAAVDEIYGVEGDTAHIKIEGPLSIEGPDFWDRFFGYNGASYKTIQAAMERAKNDPVIKRVIFDVDSPGGSVDGVDETWQAHKALAAKKPTEVRAGGTLSSAAYYISVPAGKILANAPTSEIGSIGVIVATYDWSRYYEDLGIKQVVITSSNAPEKFQDISTEHGRDSIKSRLDALERIFYSRVAESRSVTTEHIAEHFGRGGLLVAQDPSAEHEDAIRAGMIDGLTGDKAEVSHNGGDGEPQVRYIDPEKDKKAQEIIDNLITSKLTAEQKEKIKNAAPPKNEKEFQDFVKSIMEPIYEEWLIENFKNSGKPQTAAEIEAEIRAEMEKRKQSPSGETNTPATAGKTQEGQNMDLSELLKANPAAAAEIEKLKADAKAEGKAEAKADFQKLAVKCTAVLEGKAYPDAVRVKACQTLRGESSLDAFEAVQSAADMLIEQTKSQQAQAETAANGSVTAEAPNLAGGEEKAAADAWAKSIADAKARGEQAKREAR